MNKLYSLVVKLIGKLIGFSSRLLDTIMKYQNVRNVKNDIVKNVIINREPGDLQFGKWTFLGEYVKIKVEKGGVLEIGDNCVIGAYTDIVVQKGGELIIGDRCNIGIRNVIRCRKEITLGDECDIGPDCKIIDHIHSLNLRGRTKDTYWSRPIKIGEAVGIFANVYVGMGATIGKCAKVSINSVVNKNVEEGTLVGGNPVEVIYSKKSRKKKLT